MAITDDKILFCAIAVPGEVEVVTKRVSGRVVSKIHGGQLDGEVYDEHDGLPGDPKAQCASICDWLRARWPRRG